jgi:YebC/PmpR family DNA-binding regulatory protein
MSGHSKWAQIKRQKATTDARKGQTFTKMAREITVAVRQGGPDPESNFRLRLALQKSREVNMPSENIERAIKRGSGATEGATLEEISYEGYGPGGAAILVQATTDNRNRAAADVRSIFTRSGGALGETGSVGWQFDARGVISIELGSQSADDITLLAIDAGAVDFKEEDGLLEVYTEPANMEAVRRELERAKVKIISAETGMVPKNVISLDDHTAGQVMRLMDRLEELDDVQRVFSNVNISDALMETYGAG